MSLNSNVPKSSVRYSVIRMTHYLSELTLNVITKEHGIVARDVFSEQKHPSLSLAISKRFCLSEKTESILTRIVRL